MTQAQAAVELEQKQIQYKLKYSRGLSSGERLAISRRLYEIHKALYNSEQGRKRPA
jgi:head-tail adaptor